MYELKAVFWDVDGTIADTEMTGHRIAFNRAFSNFSLGWYWDQATYAQLLSIAGGENRINYFNSSICAGLNRNDIKEIHLLKQKYYTELVSTGSIKIRTGVLRLIDELSEAGVDQLIITSSSRSALFPLLKKYFPDYENKFRYLITQEDVVNVKPDPEPYKLAILKSGINPRNTLVIEDSLIGLQSASSADIKVLITQNSFISEDIGIYNRAAVVCSSLGDDSSDTIIYKGPGLKSKFITSNYLSDIINL